MLSVEAQRVRERLFSLFSPVEPPLPERRRGWEEAEAALPLPDGISTGPVIAGGVPSLWVEMPGAWAGKVFLFLHGGGYNAGSARLYRRIAALLGRATQLKLLVPDYRLAPEHPFPEAVDDAMAAYDWLRGQGYAPQDIVVGGDSAGGGLTLSLLLALREAGKPLPLAAIALSPWTDLTCSSASYEAYRDKDCCIWPENLREAGLIYAGRTDPRDPIASPLFAELRGLPPLLIHVGGDEVMLDDSRVFAERARAAGVAVTYKAWPGLWHVFHGTHPTVPEAEAALGEIGAFVAAQLAATVAADSSAA